MTGPERPAGVRPVAATASIAGAPPEAPIVLYGSRILDLIPRSDLGPGLQAGQPTAFALVRGYGRQGRFARLPAPVVLAVTGEGSKPLPADVDAEPGERLWEARADGPALLIDLRQGTLAELLGL